MSIHKSSFLRRLLLEKALDRYLTALKQGNMDEVAAVLLQASEDAALEKMIFGLHEGYQSEEAFLAMFQEENIMEIEEGIHKSHRQGQPVEEEDRPEQAPERKLPGRARRFQVLAAILLIVCLASGGLLYARLRQGGQKATVAHSTGWCESSGASIPPQDGTPSLVAVSAITPENVWAVGYTDTGDASKNADRSLPLIEHWDGAAWTIALPLDRDTLFKPLEGWLKGAANESAMFNSLTVLSANDIWAVGSVELQQVSPQLNLVKQVGYALIEHWNGSTWQRLSTPANLYSLNSISAVSANDIWAVGEQDAANGNAGTPGLLIEHWNGQNWRTVALPAGLQWGTFTSVQAISANDVWVLGSNPQSQPNTLAIHWNGVQWSAIQLPAELQDSYIQNISAIAPDDIWMLAQNFIGTSGGFSPIIEHWDGKAWSATNQLGMSLLESRAGIVLGGLNGLVARSDNDIWVTGYTSAHAPLILHWDGQQWSVALQASSPTGYALRSASIVNGKMWAVGEQIDSKITSTRGVIEVSC